MVKALCTPHIQAFLICKAQQDLMPLFLFCFVSNFLNRLYGQTRMSLCIYKDSHKVYHHQLARHLPNKFCKFFWFFLFWKEYDCNSIKKIAFLKYFFIKKLTYSVSSIIDFTYSLSLVSKSLNSTRPNFITSPGSILYPYSYSEKKFVFYFILKLKKKPLLSHLYFSNFERLNKFLYFLVH